MKRFRKGVLRRGSCVRVSPPVTMLWCVRKLFSDFLIKGSVKEFLVFTKHHLKYFFGNPMVHNLKEPPLFCCINHLFHTSFALDLLAISKMAKIDHRKLYTWGLDGWFITSWSRKGASKNGREMCLKGRSRSHVKLWLGRNEIWEVVLFNDSYLFLYIDIWGKNPCSLYIDIKFHLCRCQIFCRRSKLLKIMYC